MTSHSHENCRNCSLGQVYDYCDYEDCRNDQCVLVGHCGCGCHTGRTCGCGYKWRQ